MAQQTRHGLYGGARSVYGGFSPKAEQTDPTPARRTKPELVYLNSPDLESLTVKMRAREPVNLNQPGREGISI